MTLPAADTLAALRGRLAALEAAKLAFPSAQATDPGPLACCGAGAFPGALHEVAAKSECETPGFRDGTRAEVLGPFRVRVHRHRVPRCEPG